MNGSCVYRIASTFFLCFDKEMFDDAISYFDVLLTVHLSIILATDQLNAQNLVL